MPSRLYGKCPSSAKTLELKISLAGPSSDRWELWIDGEQWTNPAIPTRKPPVLLGDRWYWDGLIILSSTQVSVQPADDRSLVTPFLRCTLRDADAANGGPETEILLAPAEVWTLAGDGSIAAGLNADQIKKRVVFVDPPPPFSDAASNDLPTAFATELRQRYASKYHYAPPVLVIVQPFPDTLIEHVVKPWLFPRQPLPLETSPTTPPPTAEAAAGSPRDESPSFACRGLIWWHGAYEAEMADDARENQLATALNPPAPSSATQGVAKEGLRSRYAYQVARHVLHRWWHTTAWKPDAKKTTRWETDAQYQRALRVVVVQLPAAGNSPPDQPAFIQYWRRLDPKHAAFAAPVSTLSAIRYAQFDVVRQLQAVASGGDPPFFFLQGTGSKKHADAVPAVSLCALPAASGFEKQGGALAAAAFDEPARLTASLDKSTKTLHLVGLHRPAKREPAVGPLQLVKPQGEISEIKDEAIKFDPASKELLITLSDIPAGGSLRTPPADTPVPAALSNSDESVEFDVPFPP